MFLSLAVMYKCMCIKNKYLKRSSINIDMDKYRDHIEQ